LEWLESLAAKNLPPPLQQQANLAFFKE